MAAEIGFVLEFFQIETIRARIQTPVEIARVIAGRVLAIFGELDRETMIRTAMQTVPKSLDDHARAKFETANRHQSLRVNPSFTATGRGRNRWRGSGHDFRK